jgi:hypothetical protein
VSYTRILLLYDKEMCIGSQNSLALGVGRAQPEREELQAAVDQLPAAGAEARHVLPGGGRDGDEPPCRARQQVSTATAHPLVLHAND